MKTIYWILIVSLLLLIIINKKEKFLSENLYDKLELLNKLIQEAERPLFLLGNGIRLSGAINKVKELIRDKVDEFRRAEFVGPTISSELLIKGLQAISFALFAILIYIWLRFEWQFGFGAVVALIHDVLFTLGVLSILNIETHKWGPP